MADHWMIFVIPSLKSIKSLNFEARAKQFKQRVHISEKKTTFFGICLEQKFKPCHFSIFFIHILTYFEEYKV
jgi:hypothetical protein